MKLYHGALGLLLIIILSLKLAMLRGMQLTVSYSFIFPWTGCQSQFTAKQPATFSADRAISLNSNGHRIHHQEPLSASKPTTKYMTYLPHGDYRMQRSALHNALMIAAYTNRTLIVPTLYLADIPIPWAPFDQLQRMQPSHMQHAQCFDPFSIDDENNDYREILWSSLVDLSSLGIPYIEQTCIHRLQLPSVNVFTFLNDTAESRFHYRLFDAEMEIDQYNAHLGKYRSAMPLSTLQHARDDNLAFGAIDGADRIATEQKQYQALNDRITQTLATIHYPLLHQWKASLLQEPTLNSCCRSKFSDGADKVLKGRSKNCCRQALWNHKSVVVDGADNMVDALGRPDLQHYVMSLIDYV
ncbi:uncharacterized protein BYT42DRAFT_572816 [Radiomyces spectabilis]|uniref:uncharacterized protein n=1 Tax=Radiomyces spectabilis TaxID=64574 RepID=UPI002220E922|nr:uncharacterized protein BYT42DRAFT_572816 [Radiomyces spectabilis]KAI8375929.1 hypothetical protein BYT42DRAFT_572816 [Radiomyces spectabilis]